MLEKEKGVFKQVISLSSYFIKFQMEGTLWENMAPDMIIGDTFLKNEIIN